MLGWMLGGRGERALETASDGDTTQIDQPDTPAPVFAARAFKSALFGTPAPQPDLTSKSRAKTKPQQPQSQQGIQPTRIDQDFDTPMKPQGILLTPGTATSRRKRVSFNHDALTTTKSISPFDGPREGIVKSTRLSEELYKARRKGRNPVPFNDSVNNDSNSNNSNINSNKSEASAVRAEVDSTWEEEEEEYDEDDGGGDTGAHDHTLDLNEPHSQSGKYWKGEFERYRTEAAAELEKLVKYKQRAKSYAREKDIEAMQLAEKLKEEQEKVIAMEKRIAENASQMAAKERVSCSAETAELLATLTTQTALATESRHRVQELEEQLEDLLQGREDYEDLPGGRRRRTTMPLPAAQDTLLEAQRELRRARNQLKELDALRDEVSSLKAQLKQAEQLNVAEQGEGANATRSESSATIRELRTQLRKAKEESARKDEGFEQLKLEYEAFRNESEAHDADTRAVLERAHAKITELKKEVKLLKTARPGEAQSDGNSNNANNNANNRPKSWQLHFAGEHVSKDDLSVEIPARHATATERSRRSLDLDDLEGDALLEAKSRSLREKYQEDAPSTRRQDDVVITAVTPGLLADRPDLGNPRWQPFVPRSPRNRANRQSSLAKRVQSGATHETSGGGGAGGKSKGFALSDLPGLRSGLRSKGSTKPTDGGDFEVDLLQNRFARLGGPLAEQQQQEEDDDGEDDYDDDEKGKKKKKGMLVLSTNTRSALPPERRAAAMARIEKRMADRALRREGYDKENLRP